MSNLLAFGGISARSSFRQEIAKAKCYGFLKYLLPTLGIYNEVKKNGSARTEINTNQSMHKNHKIIKVIKIGQNV